MKKILSVLIVLLVLVGCTTGNNTPDNSDVVAKVAFDGVVYVETEEVSETVSSDWGYSGTISQIVSEDKLTDETAGFVSNSVPVGSEVYMSNSVEDSLLVKTSENEFTQFNAAE